MATSNKGAKPTELVLNPIRRAELREINTEILEGMVLPERIALRLGRGSYGAQEKFFSDLSLLEEPVALLNVLNATALTSVDEEDKPVFKVNKVTRGFTQLATSYSVALEAADDSVGFKLLDMLTVGREANRSDVERLLIANGAERDVRRFGVYLLYDVVFDLDRNTINRKPLKKGILNFADSDRVKVLTHTETMYYLISGALAAVQRSTKGAKKVFSGMIDVAFGKSTDGEHLLNQDPAAQAYFQAKPPILVLDMTPTGFSLRPMEEKNLVDVYDKVTRAAKFLSAHYQGKYFYDVRSGALPMDVDLEEGFFYLCSKSIAKAFKRHTLAQHLAMNLKNPDTGYFSTSNGEKHLGRRVPVWIMQSGLNFPYLGMIPSLLDNEALAALMGVIEEEVHTFTWAGDLRNKLRPVWEGTEVTKGQTLIHGAPEATPARIAGKVSYLEPLQFEAGMTSMKIVVTAEDKDGEFKLRSQVLKGQPCSVGFINPDYAAVCETLGLPAPIASNGDFAIIDGVKPGEPVPVFLYTEDAAKINGDKSNAAGIVALEAETSKTPTVFSAKAMYKGKYKKRLEKFRKEQTRTVRVKYMVTKDTFDRLMLAARPDVTLTAFSNLSDKQTLYIAVQTTLAMLAYDLVKVEYSPVKDSCTTTRFPLETAVMARVFGMNNYAEEIYAGGVEAFEAVKAVNNAVARPGAGGQLVLPDGRTLKEAGIGSINVNAKPSPKLAEQLRGIANDPRLLNVPICFVNKQEVTKDGKQFTELHDWVIVDPAFLRALGGSKDTAQTIGSFVSQLCTAIADGDTELAVNLVPRLAGKVIALADSQKTSKRVNRGVIAVVSKTVGAMVPDGWTALSYYGNVARMMARAAGCFKVSEKPNRKRTLATVRSNNKKTISLRGENRSCKTDMTRKQFMPGLSALMVPDVLKWLLSGAIGSKTRSPQQAPLPTRYYTPDAPPEVWEKLVTREVYLVAADGRLVPTRLVPEGASRCVKRLEPHRTYMGPRDSSYCHGDHDGDQRQDHPAEQDASKVELIEFDVETHRLGTLELLQINVEDPAIDTFKLDPKKAKIATEAVRMSIEDMHSQNRRTIHHQTVVVGQTYTLAHFALTRADRKPSSSNAMAAHAMWVGPYEVNLGGADDDQIALFELLEKNPFVKNDKPDYEKWEAAVHELAAKVNWTGKTADMLLAFNKEAKACAAIEHDFDSPLSGMDLIRALQAGLFRRISAGFMVNGEVNGLIAKVYDANINVPGKGVVSVRETIRGYANAGSISARVITRFYDEVYPLVVSRLAKANAEDNNGGF